jgi:hypothetical protein
VSEGSSRTTGVLNACETEEGVRWVVLAWKLIVSLEFGDFRQLGLSHPARVHLRRLAGVREYGLRPARGGHPHHSWLSTTSARTLLAGSVIALAAPVRRFDWVLRASAGGGLTALTDARPLQGSRSETSRVGFGGGVPTFELMSVSTRCKPHISHHRSDDDRGRRGAHCSARPGPAWMRGAVSVSRGSARARARHRAADFRDPAGRRVWRRDR